EGIQLVAGMLWPFSGRSYQPAGTQPTSVPPAASPRARRSATRPHPIARKPGASTLLAGQVQLLGMSKIKNSIGARWDDLAGAAYQIVEESIREFLTDDDTYERRDDEIYVLCFANADKAEAEAITESI